MAFVGLDIGTTGCKATVIDANGIVLSYAYQEYAPAIVDKGRAEICANTVWDSAKEVLRQAAIKTDAQIQAIAVATFGETFVCLNDQGHVIGNSILYSDERGTDEVKDIQQVIDKKTLFNTTGIPLGSMYTLSKLLWIKKHTSNYQHSKYIMLYGDFIAYKLTGERRIDYSLASRTMLFDFYNKTWSTHITSLFNIDTAKLSTPIASGEIIGNILPSVAKVIGVTPKTLVVAGGHDQVCAALGAGVLGDGDCVDGMGTSECITAILSDTQHTDHMLHNSFCIEPYVNPGQYVTLAFHLCAGATIDWYRSTIEKERNAAYRQSGKNIHAAMESECPRTPTSLFVLPHMAGTGTPYMDATASGAILGIKLGTTRGEMYKACLEGMCFEIMLNAMLLKEIGTNIISLKCVGGVSRSDLLLQIKADIMGIPVTRLCCNESGTMGLAMMGLVACGVYKDFNEAAAVMVKPDKTFEPNLSYHEIYMEKFGVYKHIYSTLQLINARNGGNQCP